MLYNQLLDTLYNGLVFNKYLLINSYCNQYVVWRYEYNSPMIVCQKYSDHTIYDSLFIDEITTYLCRELIYQFPVTILALCDNKFGDGIKQIPKSNSHALDSFIYCSLNYHGVKIIENIDERIVFNVFDFKKYFDVSNKIISKNSLCICFVNRSRALARWFKDFPIASKKLKNPFDISITKSSENFETIKLKLLEFKLYSPWI